MSLVERLVIVPAFNEQQHIPLVLKALDPLKDDPRYDILVIDDGSTDNTAEISAECDVAVLQHKKRRGKTQALKSGLGVARELKVPLLASIDADTVNLKPEMVHALLDPLDLTNEGGLRKYHMVVGSYREYTPDTKGQDPVEPKIQRGYDLMTCGQRGFAVEAFEPWFSENNKWMTYLSGRWPEMGLRKLIPREKTLYLPELVFIQRGPFRAGSVASVESMKFFDEQNVSAHIAEKYYRLRQARAENLRANRKLKMLEDDVRPVDKQRRNKT